MAGHPLLFFGRSRFAWQLQRDIGPTERPVGRITMKVQDQPARGKEDETHGQQFWRATQQWGERLRQQKVTLQVVKVAWALERRFSSHHGISYVGRETLANDSGVADVGDVRKALQAMAGARLIEEVAPDDVKDAMRADAARRGGGSRPVGRPPIGYRMVLSASGERFLPSIEALIGRADDEPAASRIGRSKGATARDADHAFRGNRPLEYERDAAINYRGNGTPITGEPSPRITGEPSHPKKMEDDVEGGGAHAPLAYSPSSVDGESEDGTRLPDGARPSLPFENEVPTVRQIRDRLRAEGSDQL